MYQWPVRVHWVEKEKKKNHINYTRPPLWEQRGFDDPNEETHSAQTWETSHWEWIAATRRRPSVVFSSPSSCSAALGLYCPPAAVALLLLPFVSLHTIQVPKCHSVLTFANSVSLSLSESAHSGKQKNVAFLSPLIQRRRCRRFILFFSLAALFSSNECPNLKGEMISSRAFSCWMEHESVPARPSGTLLANKADFAPSKSKLSTARILFFVLTINICYSTFTQEHFSSFFFFGKSCSHEDSWRFPSFFVVSAKMCLSCLIRAKLKRSSSVDEGTSHETSGTASLCGTFCVNVIRKKRKKNNFK